MIAGLMISMTKLLVYNTTITLENQFSQTMVARQNHTAYKPKKDHGGKTSQGKDLTRNFECVNTSCANFKY